MQPAWPALPKFKFKRFQAVAAPVLRSWRSFGKALAQVIDHGFQVFPVGDD